MMSEQVMILGASGHGKVVAEVVEAAGDTVVGFLDDDSEKKLCGGHPVLGPIVDAGKYKACRFIIAIGNNALREKIARSMKLPWYTAIHPTAVVSPSAVLGEGTVIMPRAVINAEAKVGCHCIINTGAIVEHENRIGDYVHISPGAALGGGVSVGRETHIGIGACVRNHIAICGGCTVGAGAVVVENLEEAGVYVGVPARRKR